MKTSEPRARACLIVRHLRSILRSRFEVALEEDLIQASPMERVRIPKAKIDRRERAVLDGR